MNILDEVQDAKKEFLQEEWDKLLLDLWRNHPNMVMGRAITSFMKQYHLGSKEFFALRRVPRSVYQQRTRITRYIAAYLPLLNTHLWNNVKTTQELLKICLSLSTMWNPADIAKVDKESKEKSDSRKQYRKGLMEKYAAKDHYSKSSRSNWDAAKK